MCHRAVGGWWSNDGWVSRLCFCKGKCGGNERARREGRSFVCWLASNVFLPVLMWAFLKNRCAYMLCLRSSNTDFGRQESYDSYLMAT